MDMFGNELMRTTKAFKTAVELMIERSENLPLCLLQTLSVSKPRLAKLQVAD
jgi:hypothetical protein